MGLDGLPVDPISVSVTGRRQPAIALQPTCPRGTKGDAGALVAWRRICVERTDSNGISDEHMTTVESWSH
eukprot:scaffold21_cov342-Pavlova_lutheri.AAC.2